MSDQIPLTIIYPGPSLHAVDFFTALHRHGGFDLEVLFCQPEFITRGSWSAPRMDFRHEYLPSKRLSSTNEFAIWNSGLVSRVRSGVHGGRVHLLGGGYSMPSVALAMITLNMLKARWYFQSEKPGISPNPIKSLLRRGVIHLCLRNCTRILAHSQLAVEAYLELGFDRKRVDFLPYYMNVDDFLKINRSWDGIESRPLRMLYLGQLHEIKGIDWAVSAMSGLRDVSDQFALDVIGDGPLTHQLGSLILNHELSDYVRLLGPIAWDDRWKAFAEHDVLLLPSRHDGWGMVVMEALASGIPVIGSLNSGAVHACIIEGVNGWRVQYHDDAALQDAVRKCINSRPGMSAMSSRARDSVCDWRPEIGARRLWEIIQSDSHSGKA